MGKRLFCEKCKRMVELFGSEGMKRKGMRPIATLIKKRHNYPFGKRSKSRITPISCNNCGAGAENIKEEVTK